MTVLITALACRRELSRCCRQRSRCHRLRRYQRKPPLPTLRATTNAAFATADTAMCPRTLLRHRRVPAAVAVARHLASPPLPPPPPPCAARRHRRRPPMFTASAAACRRTPSRSLLPILSLPPTPRLSRSGPPLRTPCAAAQCRYQCLLPLCYVVGEPQRRAAGVRIDDRGRFFGTAHVRLSDALKANYKCLLQTVISPQTVSHFPREVVRGKTKVGKQGKIQSTYLP